jgi:hypothetical protein
MKNFSLRTFIRASLIMGGGLFFTVLVNQLIIFSSTHINLFWKIISMLWVVFSFPVIELYWLFGAPEGNIFLLGFVLNCIFNGLLIERLFYLYKRKSNFPPVPTGI